MLIVMAMLIKFINSIYKIMKKIKNLLLLSLLIFVASCGNNNKNEQIFSNKNEEIEIKITANDIPGTYNNFKINNQFKIKSDGSLEFYTATSMTPHIGYWKLKDNKITIGIPTWITDELLFTVTKKGFLNDEGELVWEKV